MAKAGDIIKDKSTGDVIEFLETSENTRGEFTKVKFTVMPGGFKPVEHIHPFFDETFKILKGILTYKLEGEVKRLGEGNEVTLPKSIAHTHYNDESTMLVMEQTFSPSLDVEIFLENLFGLSRDERIKNGEPELLQVLVWLKKLKAKTYLAKIPITLQNFLSGLLSPLAYLLGYRASYRKYNDIEL